MSPALKNIIFIALVFIVASLIARLFTPGAPYSTAEFPLGPLTPLWWLLGFLFFAALAIAFFRWMGRSRKDQW